MQTPEGRANERRSDAGHGKTAHLSRVGNGRFSHMAQNELDTWQCRLWAQCGHSAAVR